MYWGHMTSLFQVKMAHYDSTEQRRNIFFTKIQREKKAIILESKQMQIFIGQGFTRIIANVLDIIQWNQLQI